MINEYGTWQGNLDEFVSTNNYNASIKLPKDCKTGREIKLYEGVPFMPIEIDSTLDWNILLDEAKQFDKHYIPHRHHEKHKGWSSLVLHGLSSVHTEAPEVYGYTCDNAPWRWTDVSEFCPNIVKMIKDNFKFNRYFRIRIMRLSPEGYIWPHVDGGFNHLGPINIAINNPENCNFYMGDIGILPFKQGMGMSLNIGSMIHSVVNNSNENRYHIIIHGGWSDKDKAMDELYYNNYLKYV